MNKTWLVIRYEFWRHVSRRGFLFAVLGLPAIFGLIMGVVILFFEAKSNVPVGVVDHSGLLLDPAAYVPAHDGVVPVIGYPDEATAQAALDSKAIQAYFVVPADYLATGRVTAYHLGDTYTGIYGDFNDYLLASLLAGAPPAVARRFIDDPLEVTFVSLSEVSSRGDPLAVAVPYVFGFMSVMAIFTTAGYLLQAVVDEKENRTMEILATSLRPEWLMVGKIVGLVGVGLLQLTIWSLGLAAGFLYIRSRLPALPMPEIPLSLALITLLWFLPFYLMIAALWAAIGVSVTEASEGQQAAGILSLLTMAPLWFAFLFFESPNSPLAVTLSLVPFTSPLTVIVRWQAAGVPAWQLLLSWLLLAGTAGLAILLVGRLLRAGMLRYGQRLTLREVATVLLHR
ncbi:MAG: ABC transporter permease [Chloroflexi bacterium]|nr:ABC transporter permease [Chloroflexota bacterium]MCI0580208.1 ABC transporter permease [Chloroflexota bacterium]MCI0646941.1 ABC transporter permease [Chloroflexota bacterium]MCI0728696.1 ABC transporter permease [Chloroflexota bacterium]